MSIGDEDRNKMPLEHNVVDPGVRQTGFYLISAT